MEMDRQRVGHRGRGHEGVARAGGPDELVDGLRDVVEGSSGQQPVEQPGGGGDRAGVVARHRGLTRPGASGGGEHFEEQEGGSGADPGAPGPQLLDGLAHPA